MFHLHKGQKAHIAVGLLSNRAKICYAYSMLFTDTGIILYRQAFKESDRIVSLYTFRHGRINVRIPGVARSTGKLKALSEPLTCADYRIYVRRGGVVGTVTGGKVNTVFSSIRTDLHRSLLALHCCELLMRLTPLHQPSEAKFTLLHTALTALNQGPVYPAFQAAFTLRLMMLAGFGLDHPVLHISPEFWQKMHEADFTQLACTEPEELLALSKCNSVCRRFLNQYLTYPLHTTEGFGLSDTLSGQETATANVDEILRPLPAAALP